MLKRLSIIFLFVSIFLAADMAGQEVPDTLVSLSEAAEEANDSTAGKTEQVWWWDLLKKGKLNLRDKNVRYPKFVKFCVDVYNWGDTTFNDFDPRYVIGTGKRWKTFLRDDNWLDSYAMHLDDVSMLMMSDVTVNIGAYLQYMAVSVGYSFDMTNIIANKPINYKKFEFGFSCALFSAEAYYTENTGGSYLRRLGDYHRHGSRYFREYFPGIKMISYGLDAYYFFNHKRYSQGAAYNFAKIQLRPAGSFMIGFTFSNQDISLDFNQLPKELLPFMNNAPLLNGKFHYNQYCMMLGYGYNLPFGYKNKFLFNVTVIPTLGVAHNFEDSFEGKRNMFSMNMKGRLALVYNQGDCFLGLNAKMDGHWYKSREYSFFNSLETLSFCAGVRF